MIKIKLHLGGGNKFIPGFTHIDLADFPHLDYKMHDIRNLPMYKDNSVDLIYCSHALQYFDREMAKIALQEWYRILEKGGILRLAVPDFEAITLVYLKYGKDLAHRGILGPLYGKILVGKHIYHKTTYDFESLKDLLESVKFKNVHKYDWRETEHADVDDFSQAYIPHLDKENGILISLNVEAEK